MSKASTPIKVIGTAIKRVNKGWVKQQWSWIDPETGQVKVCMEGGLYGYCEATKYGLTEAQMGARDVVLEIIKERYGDHFQSIAQFNDHHETTLEMVVEIFKLAQIRLETGGGPDDEIEENEFDEILEWAANN